jgi:hypothetical protein
MLLSLQGCYIDVCVSSDLYKQHRIEDYTVRVPDEFLSNPDLSDQQKLVKVRQLL